MPPSLLESLRFLLLRDLRSLDQQVAAYPDDESLWITAPGISNSAGNLVLHLTGNLRHFFGATFGDTGYMRDRAAEFATKSLSREALRREIAAAIDDVETSLGRIDESQLDRAYPLAIAERQVRTADFLAHLAVHLTYHLGQIDYHRRLLTQDPIAVENVSVRELPEGR
jgi:uncharacterized damage-inducible protein DinB